MLFRSSFLATFALFAPLVTAGVDPVDCEFDSLLALVDCAGIGDALDRVTVFGPCDFAFARFLDETGFTVNDLCTTYVDELIKILTYHVVADEIFAADIVGSDENLVTLTTLQGGEIKINRDRLTVNGNKIVNADAQLSPFVLHGIDGVLIPPTFRQEEKKHYYGQGKGYSYGKGKGKGGKGKGYDYGKGGKGKGKGKGGKGKGGKGKGYSYGKDYGKGKGKDYSYGKDYGGKDYSYGKDYGGKDYSYGKDYGGKDYSYGKDYGKDKGKDYSYGKDYKKDYSYGKDYGKGKGKGSSYSKDYGKGKGKGYSSGKDYGKGKGYSYGKDYGKGKGKGKGYERYP